MTRWLASLATLILLTQLWSVAPFVMAEDDAPATPATGTAEVQLQDEGADINDSGSFDVGNILSTEGQDTSRFLDSEEGPIASIVLTAINFITLVFGAIAMLFIIVGGLLMIVSEGDENRLQKGKGILAAAIIGLVIAMFAYIIVRFFQSIFY